MADIGCSGTIQNSLGAYGYHALHGRVLPAAGGAALANPELTVIGAGGDGDGYAIGVGHLVHAFRRNVSLSDGSPQTCSTARRMRLRSSGRRRRPPSTPAQLRPRTRRSSTASRSEAARPPETPARAPGALPPAGRPPFRDLATLTAYFRSVGLGGFLGWPRGVSLNHEKRQARGGGRPCVCSCVRLSAAFPPRSCSPRALPPGPLARPSHGPTRAFRYWCRPLRARSSTPGRSSPSGCAPPCRRAALPVRVPLVRAGEGLRPDRERRLHVRAQAHERPVGLRDRLLRSWTSKPGTYFWQAYRVEYRDGADGCIDSEVRSLVIKAAAPTPTPKPKPTPTPTPPKPKAPGALHRGGSAAGGGRHVSMRFDAPPTSAAQGLGPISSSAERARSCTSWRRASTSPS